MAETQHKDEDEEATLSDQQREQMAQERTGFWAAAIRFFRSMKIGEMSPHHEVGAEMIESQSSLEFWRSCAMRHTDLLVDASKQQSPIDRMLAVVKYVISYTRLTPGRKKPLNPILGEFSIAKSKHGDSESLFLSEQTSHHPPIANYVVLNAKHGIRFEGQTAAKLHFTGFALHIQFHGARVITFEKLDEQYEISSPELVIRIFRGAAEFNSWAIIKCAKTGVVGKVHYKSKPLFSGSWHAIEGTVADGKGDLNYEIRGNWDSVLSISNVLTKSTTQWTVDNDPIQILTPKQLEDRSSEKVWKELKDAAEKGDSSGMSKAKHKVEEEQRERRKNNTDFDVRYFSGDEKQGFKWNKKFPTWDGQPMEV